jgi:hypothetical protein
MNKAKMSKSEDSDFHDLDRTIIDVRKSADWYVGCISMTVFQDGELIWWYIEIIFVYPSLPILVMSWRNHRFWRGLFWYDTHLISATGYPLYLTVSHIHCYS